MNLPVRIHNLLPSAGLARMTAIGPPGLPDGHPAGGIYVWPPGGEVRNPLDDRADVAARLLRDKASDPGRPGRIDGQAHLNDCPAYWVASPIATVAANAPQDVVYCRAADGGGSWAIARVPLEPLRRARSRGKFSSAHQKAWEAQW